MVFDTQQNKNGHNVVAGDKIAAIDLGTNSCRLLISRYTGRGTYCNPLHSFSKMVRLGKGLSENGVLSKESMERTISALKICAKKMKYYEVRHYRAVATAACRMAENREALLDQIRDVTGLEVEIIESDEEATLSLLGCANLLRPEIPYGIVFDIGGGSTEVLWISIENGGHLKILDLVSLPIGVVTPAAHLDAWQDMMAQLKNALHTLSHRHNIAEALANDQVQMVGTSGTITTMAAIHQNLPKYDRSNVDGFLFPAQDLLNVISQLHDMSPKQRSRQPCVGPGRAELLMPGIKIFQAIYSQWPVPYLCVADRGVREGILTKIICGDSNLHGLVSRSHVTNTVNSTTDLAL